MNHKQKHHIPLSDPQKSGAYTFEDLYKEYHKQLFVGFCRMTRGEVIMDQSYNNPTKVNRPAFNWVAEDLAQDTMLKVLTYFDKIDWTLNIRPLLQMLAIRTIVDYKRAGDGMDVGVRHDKDPLYFIDNVFEGMRGVDPLSLILEDAELIEVFNHIEEYRSIDKTIVEMLFIKEMQPKDAADELGISYGNLRLRLKRLRDKLRGEHDRMEW